MTFLADLRGNKILCMIMAFLFLFDFVPAVPRAAWAASFDDGITTTTVDGPVVVVEENFENPDEPADEEANTEEASVSEEKPTSTEFLGVNGVIAPATPETSGAEASIPTGETSLVSSTITSGSGSEILSPESGPSGTDTEDSQETSGTEVTTATGESSTASTPSEPDASGTSAETGTETEGIIYDEDGNIVNQGVPSSTIDDAFYVPGEGLAYADIDENFEDSDASDDDLIEGYTYANDEDYDDVGDAGTADDGDDLDDWEFASFENPPVPSFEHRGSSLRAQSVTVPPLTSTNAGLRARLTAYNSYYRAGTESLASTTGINAATNQANETANRGKVLARLGQFKRDLEEMNTELVRYFDHLLPLVLQDLDNGADVTAKRNLLIALTQARLWIKGPAEFLNLNTTPPTWRAGYADLARALGAAAVGHTDQSGATLSQWAANYFASGTAGLWVPYPPTIGRTATSGWVGITANRRNNGWLGFALEAEAKLGEANQALGNAERIWNGNSHTGAFRIGLAEGWYALNRNGSGLVPQGAKQIINTTMRQMHDDDIAPPPVEAPAPPATPPQTTQPQTPPPAPQPPFVVTGSPRFIVGTDNLGSNLSVEIIVPLHASQYHRANIIVHLIKANGIPVYVRRTAYDAEGSLISVSTYRIQRPEEPATNRSVEFRLGDEYFPRTSSYTVTSEDTITFHRNGRLYGRSKYTYRTLPYPPSGVSSDVASSTWWDYDQPPPTFPIPLNQATATSVRQRLNISGPLVDFGQGTTEYNNAHAGLPTITPAANP